jgi:hypothetical protein
MAESCSALCKEPERAETSGGMVASERMYKEGENDRVYVEH